MKEFSKEEIRKFIATNTEAQSLLYDLDLLPEQLASTGQEGKANWIRMLIIGNLMMCLKEAQHDREYMYKDIDEYKSIAWPDKPEMEVNEAFRIGWDMARSTNSILRQMAENSGGTIAEESE